jgi:hypothetical protein
MHDDLPNSSDDAMSGSVMVRLWVPKEDRDSWQAAAEADRSSLSEWIRRRCNGSPASEPLRGPASAILGTDHEQELILRAIRSFMRDGGEQPSSASGIEEIGGQPYVVLYNVNGPLGYYQIVGPNKTGAYALKFDAEMSRKRGSKR